MLFSLLLTYFILQLKYIPLFSRMSKNMHVTLLFVIYFAAPILTEELTKVVRFNKLQHNTATSFRLWFMIATLPTISKSIVISNNLTTRTPWTMTSHCLNVTPNLLRSVLLISLVSGQIFVRLILRFGLVWFWVFVSDNCRVFFAAVDFGN